MCTQLRFRTSYSPKICLIFLLWQIMCAAISKKFLNKNKLVSLNSTQWPFYSGCFVPWTFCTKLMWCTEISSQETFFSTKTVTFCYVILASLEPHPNSGNQKNNTVVKRWQTSCCKSEQDDNLKKRSLSIHVVSRSYRPPEVIILETKYRFSVDVWSAGCVLAEIILN